jgi:hypothetical protein
MVCLAVENKNKAEALLSFVSLLSIVKAVLYSLDNFSQNCDVKKKQRKTVRAGIRAGSLNYWADIYIPLHQQCLASLGGYFPAYIYLEIAVTSFFWGIKKRLLTELQNNCKITSEFHN